MVPEGWDVATVSHLIKTKDIIGVQDGNHGNDHPKASDYVESGIPFVMARDLKQGAVNTKTCSFIKKEHADSLRIGFAKPGDVLLSHKGTIGATAIVPEGYEYIMLTPQVTYYRVNKNGKLDKDYLYQYFNGSEYQEKLNKLASQSTRNYLGITAQKELLIKLPPIEEQKKIAQILSIWDKTISTTKQLITNSQQQKRALMQQLLTGKKHLLDKSGARFSGEWKDLRLLSLLREEKLRNRDSSIERVLSVTNHSGFVLPEDQFSKRVASENVSNYKVVKKGQYGYNPSRLNVGSFARLDRYEEGLLSPMYVVFSVKEQLLNSDYFLNWMSSNEAKQRIARSTQGSVRDSVGFDSLCRFPFKLPPMDEQQKIAYVLSTADQEITALQKKLDVLKLEKKALMQQLLTGKRRVKTN